MANFELKTDPAKKTLFILLAIAVLFGVLLAYTPWQGKIILAVVVGFFGWKIWNYMFK